MSFQSNEQEIQQPLSYELYTLQYDNKIYRFTSYEADVEYGGWTYKHIAISRGDIAIGNSSMEFGSCSIKLPASILDVNDSSFDPPYEFIIEIRQIHAITGDNIIILSGVIISIEQDNQGLTLFAKNETYNMFENVPKVRVQRSCNNRLFDDTCGLQRMAYVMYVEVTDFNMNIPVSSEGTTYWNNKFTKERLKFVDPPVRLPYYSINYRNIKANSHGNYLSDYSNFEGEIKLIRTGRRYYLAAHNNATAEILCSPYIPNLQIGDILEITVGCAKDPVYCNSLGNIYNFVGFPYIPLQDVVLQGASTLTKYHVRKQGHITELIPQHEIVPGSLLDVIAHEDITSPISYNMELKCTEGSDLPVLYGFGKLGGFIIYFDDIEQIYDGWSANVWIAYCLGKTVPLYIINDTSQTDWATASAVGFDLRFNNGDNIIYPPKAKFTRLAADGMTLNGVTHLWLDKDPAPIGYAGYTFFNLMFGTIIGDYKLPQSQLVLKRDLTHTGLSYSEITYTPGDGWTLDAPFNNSFGSNPASVIYDLLTNTQYGLGISTNKINIGSFESASIAFNTLRYGISLTLDTAAALREIINDICNVVGAIVRVDLDGLIELKQIDLSDPKDPIITITDDDVDVTISRKFHLETINEIRGTFTDPNGLNFKPGIISAQNEANILNTGSRRSMDLNLQMITNKDVAKRIITEHLKERSYPNIYGTIKAKRGLYNILPGDVLHYVSSQYGLDIPIRIISKTFPATDSNIVSLEFVEVPVYAVDENFIEAENSNGNIPVVVPVTGETLTFPAFSDTSTAASAPWGVPANVRVRWTSGQEQSGDLENGVDFTVHGDGDKIILTTPKFDEDIEANALGLLSIDVWEIT